ncbi:MAG TPA: undecaprenyl-diphosphatase UppP [Thermomicrobiales bacterium]|nr:undecaprenyl-diphosphatase UppP [Thermomicrobiales bacterium]
MAIWQAIVLGIVQGLTEFLPISSSAHLIIFPWLFEWQTSSLSFDAALHLGTLVAVVIYFRAEIIRMIAAIPLAISRPAYLLTTPGDELNEREQDGKLGWLLVIATIPGLIVGALLESKIDEYFHTDDNSRKAIAMIATMMIVVGLVLGLAERVAKHVRPLTSIGWVDALIIGCAQALAVIPGTSRSGATLTAGLFRGIKRADAARFSFLAGMPLILGAGVKAILDAADKGMTQHEVVLFIVGAVTAGIVGFATIWGLLKFLQRQDTMVFVIYRVVFGLFLFLMLAIR